MSDIGRPTAQMPDQVLLQFIGCNLLPKSGERSGRFPLPASLDVIHWRRIGPIVVQEGTDMQQIVNVQTEIVEIGRKLRWTIDIARDDMKRRALRLVQRLLG